MQAVDIEGTEPEEVVELERVVADIEQQQCMCMNRTT